MTAIVVENLSKHYGDRIAVDRLTFDVKRGSITGFVGPNGAGKTTTIRMLLGLVRPTSGRATVCGVDVTSSHRAAHKVGAIVETPSAYLGLSALDNLRVFSLSSGVRASTATLMALLTRVGLHGRERDLVRGFSLGMKQRLGIAATLVHNPDVLFLDEPMNGLDPGGTVEMRALLLELSREGKTIFVSSHALHEVQQTCDTVVVVAGGKQRYAGPLAGLLGDEHIVIKTNDAAHAARVAVSVFPSLKVECRDDDVIVHAPASSAPPLVRALVAAGLDVIAVTPMAASLERAFFAVTEQVSA
jgi:ABC-2 type transport system ATP-binding protein